VSRAICLPVVFALTVVAYAAPSDTVPFDHWAYDAVEKLVDAGVIVGYPPNFAFHGDRALTRYEFAMAISRLMEWDGLKGADGKPGSDGAPGATGPAGPKGDAGAAGATGPTGDKGEKGEKGDPADKPTESELRVICAKLLDEFSGELADLKDRTAALEGEVEDLDTRAAALEEAMKRPKVTGWIDYRMGLVGDLWNNAEFDALTARIGIEGQINAELYGKITLKAVDDARRVVEARLAPIILDPLGMSDPLWLDEALVEFDTRWLLPVEWTVGRQYVRYASGLAVNNDRLSQQGVHWAAHDIRGSNLHAELFVGYSYYDEGNFFFIDHDHYTAYRLSYEKPNWSIAGTHLLDGAGDEQAWSADVAARLWGRDVAFEYAQMYRSAYRSRLDGVEAWMGSVELVDSPGLRVTGVVSRADADYGLTFSSLFPYYETLQYDLATYPGAIPWERWTRNAPIFRGARAISAIAAGKVGSAALELRYVNLEPVLDAPPAYWPDYAVGNYRHLLALSASHRVVDGLDATLTWGHQSSDVGGLDDLDLLQAAMVASF